MTEQRDDQTKPDHAADLTCVGGCLITAIWIYGLAVLVKVLLF
jgi:hypothetical protein